MASSTPPSSTGFLIPEDNAVEEESSELVQINLGSQVCCDIYVTIVVNVVCVGGGIQSHLLVVPDSNSIVCNRHLLMVVLDIHWTGRE